jgi:hypothetical protein
MILRHHIAMLTCVLSLTAALTHAQDQMTEQDVVSTLNGKPRVSAPGQPVGVAIYLTFSPQTTGEDQGKRASSGGHARANDALYRAVIPLARALEAGVATGSRYLMRLSPPPSLPAEQADRVGQQLRDTAAHFSTTYFAIPPERLSLQVVPPTSMAQGQTPPASELQRWRIEVFRLD